MFFAGKPGVKACLPRPGTFESQMKWRRMPEMRNLIRACGLVVLTAILCSQPQAWASGGDRKTGRCA